MIDLVYGEKMAQSVEGESSDLSGDIKSSCTGLVEARMSTSLTSTAYTIAELRDILPLSQSAMYELRDAMSGPQAYSESPDDEPRIDPVGRIAAIQHLKL